MPRTARKALGGIVYEVHNYAAGRSRLFAKKADYQLFEKVLAEAVERMPSVKLLSYCLMPTHWHLVLKPRKDGELSTFMRWVAVTHAQRLHSARKSAGTGPIYQGRFKSFPVQANDNFLMLCRFIECHPVRAKKAKKASDWQWSSLTRRTPRGRAGLVVGEDVPALSDWPVERPRNWSTMLNKVEPKEDVKAIRNCLKRGAPLGKPAWIKSTVKKLDLGQTVSSMGRPRLEED